MSIGTNGSKRPDGRSSRLVEILTLLASIPESGPSDHSDHSNQYGAQGLVVEFDEAYTCFVEGFEQLPSESQMIALQAVDTKLSAMIGAKDATLWTLRARREDQIWVEARQLVDVAIESFARSECAEAAPPHSGATLNSGATPNSGAPLPSGSSKK